MWPFGPLVFISELIYKFGVFIEENKCGRGKCTCISCSQRIIYFKVFIAQFEVYITHFKVWIIQFEV